MRKLGGIERLRNSPTSQLLCLQVQGRIGTQAVELKVMLPALHGAVACEWDYIPKQDCALGSISACMNDSIQEVMPDYSTLKKPA